MDYVKFYQTVAKEFDEATAICAVVAATVLYTKKIKTRHTNKKGLFTEEVIRTIHDKLFEHSEVDPVLCFACVLAWNEYRDRIALEGLGGCVVIAFDVLVKEHLEELKGVRKGPSKMKIKTSELTGAALDWAVAKCEGLNPAIVGGLVREVHQVFGPVLEYSTDWAQGGPIIEREAHNLFKHNGGTQWCCACYVPRDECTAIVTADGPTPLIAAMRCYVASKLGDKVDIPEELLQ